MDQEKILENERDCDARSETDGGRGGKLAQPYRGRDRRPLLLPGVYDAFSARLAAGDLEVERVSYPAS